MRILWFTNTPSLASEYYNFKGVGGGWLKGLEAAIKTNIEYELAIAFHTRSEKGYTVLNGTEYFPIKYRENKFQLHLKKHINYDDKSKYLNSYLDIIDKYKPDIIQIFGTEMGYTQILGRTKIPVCVHIQGILCDYQNYFFNQSISKAELLFNSPIRKIIAGSTDLHTYWVFKRGAKHEIISFPKCSYYLGRTDYDKSFVNQYAPNARYFYCNEMLRSEFYLADKWTKPENNKFVILTTNNGEIYKGIDLVLKSTQILKDKGFDFEWRIAGINNKNSALRFFERKLKINHLDNSIVLLGSLNVEDLIGEIQLANLFVHPSRIDNSPNSICEAQMIGLPVLAFETGGIPSLIESNSTGWLVKTDPYLLAEKIIEIAKDNDELKKISNNEILVAEQRHNKDLILFQLKNAYDFIKSENKNII